MASAMLDFYGDAFAETVKLLQKCHRGRLAALAMQDNGLNLDQTRNGALVDSFSLPDKHCTKMPQH